MLNQILKTIKSNKRLVFGAGILIVLCTVLIWQKITKKLPPAPPLPQVAIVIDDWGYNEKYLDFLKATDLPVTISILPNLRYTKTVAAAAADAQKEVILHLPLEPLELRQKYVRLEKNTILCAMPADKINAILNQALASVQYAHGVSNHMGSKVTQNPQTLKVIFKELKQRRLFFLDNLVTDDSVAGETAAEIGIKFAERDVFIDNENNPQYIKGQIEELLQHARAHGRAIGIAHARKETIEVLKAELPRIKSAGFELVFVSELTK